MASSEGRLVAWQIEDGVAVITINHPPVNALNRRVMQELDQCLDEIAADPNARALIVTGAGEKAFVAGADISEFPSLTGEVGEKMSAAGQAVLDKLEALAIPTIAAINGFALGGGCELALACDIRVAAENARLGQPEVNLGVIPGYGGTQRLARVVGPGKAKELIFTGEHITAAEAYRIGLVDRLVPVGQALAEAKNLAQTILKKGPLAIRAAKKAINQGLDLPLKEGLKVEARLFGELCNSEDQKEGAKAFLEKRPAQFKGK